MITDAILDMIHAVIEGVFGWLADHLPSAPGWWVEIGDAVEVVLGEVGEPIRWFLPLGPLVVAGGVFMGILVTLGLLQLVRKALSLGIL